MPLSPSTQRAVTRAIQALHSEVGEAGEYKDLLTSMKTAVGSGSSADELAHRDAPGRDGPDDDYSFDTAARRHEEKATASKAAEAKAEAATSDAAEGGEGK
jgi:hypothetical protein